MVQFRVQCPHDERVFRIAVDPEDFAVKNAARLYVYCDKCDLYIPISELRRLSWRAEK